jgi:AraC-like DNA-binding protein
MELVFHYGDLFTKYHPNGRSVFQPRSFIHGQLTRFIEIGGNGTVGVFSIRFHPQGLKSFVSISLNEINDSAVSIDQLWGAAARELEDRILHAGHNEDRVRIVEDFLLQKLSPSPVNHLVGRSVTMIDQQKGLVSIDELSLRLNTSRRHLERQFISATGLSPKQYGRITRLQYILSLAEQGKFNTLTDLAYDAGFYDQAHFIKDFKTFTGLSPKQYFSAYLPLVKFFHLE